MGSAKEQLSEIRREEIDRRIAGGGLGIAASDLEDHPYQLDENASDDRRCLWLGDHLGRGGAIRYSDG